MSGAQRIQRQRAKGWRMPEGTIYVGRPSKWGNPYNAKSIPAAQAIAQYRDLIERCVASNRECAETDYLSIWDRNVLQHITDALAGHDLACWCPLDQPCHADVLLEIANQRVMP